MDSSDDVSVVLNNSTSSTASKIQKYGSIAKFFHEIFREILYYFVKKIQVKKFRTNKSLRI